MSVCAHDPYCPGHGPYHDDAMIAQARRDAVEHGGELYRFKRDPIAPMVPARGASRDRTLAGKDRIQARKAARR